MVKIGRSTDNMCTFCKKYPETIQHLLAECHIVTLLWSQLETWILKKIGIPFKLDKFQILFGTDVKENNNVANLIIILTKFHIYRNRCQNIFPSLTPLQGEIKNITNSGYIFFTKTKKLNYLRINGRCGGVYLKELNNKNP